MNNLLIELAKRCGYWSGETIEMNDVGLQKFTEYIIQDCIKTISSTNTKYGDYRDQITTSYQEYVIQTIKDKYK